MCNVLNVPLVCHCQRVFSTRSSEAAKLAKTITNQRFDDIYNMVGVPMHGVCKISSAHHGTRARMTTMVWAVARIAIATLVALVVVV